MAVTSKSTFNIRIIAALLLIALGIAGIFLFLIPKKGEFDENKILLTQKQSELSRLKTQLVEFQNVESEFEGSEVTMNDILNLIPQNIEQDKIIEELSDIASDNEVSLNSVSFGTGTGRDLDLQVVTMTLNITGTHTNLINFIEGLEDSGRKFNIKTLSLQMLENRLENMSINVECYHQ